MKIFKINETENYGKCFVTTLPIKFFFDKDGTYDGLEFDVRRATSGEIDLVRELCEMIDNDACYCEEGDEEEEEESELSCQLCGDNKNCKLVDTPDFGNIIMCEDCRTSYLGLCNDEK